MSIYVFTKTVLAFSKEASRQISVSTDPPFPLLIFLKSEEAILEILQNTRIHLYTTPDRGKQASLLEQ